MTVDTRSISNPTNLPNLHEFTGKFTYKGKNVTDLYIAEVEFKNSGDVTIFGEGPKKNIISEYISFAIPSGYKILSVNNFDNALPIEISVGSDNLFSIKVSQVRKEEIFWLKVYAEKVYDIKEDLSIYPIKRDLM